ncbi:manganese-dependent inorganic pyrophosphatase [Veillonella sp. R32]|uniref:manganese-dependent inorganic pyrophosphatase n=1 Tax=Veillonella sp. R32 TaxID=2021312 RepID=UPI001389C791|nr:manganese-dependent inorganic pyrophosphatase [Veillonella sp. R32]KAF1679178.1 manganese-dependent inorganic pyrophosphatase [Veillonella sp. R32]
MSENVIFVTGHKSPDTDSFCSALGYANLKNQMGIPAKAICAGPANKETSFVLDYFKVEHPEIVTSFAVRIKDVLETVPAVEASANLEAVLAWRKEHDMNRVPVVKDGKFVGVILPSRLIDALANAWLDKTSVTAGDIVSKAGCQLISPDLKLKEFDRGHNGAFPVVDGDTYFGMVRSNVEAPKDKQKVILIDHNEKVQIIDDIEDAEIVENVDHHRIGGLVTENPIFIHYEPVGCSCTIVANFYWQYGQEIPKHIAGLLLSAIISDTVLFRSPTCTPKDVETAKKLATIAGVDLEAYGLEMLKAGADVSDFSDEKIVRTDMKEFSANGQVFTIGQLSTMNAEEVLTRKPALLKALEELRAANNYVASYIMVTDILKESTNLLFAGDVEAIVKAAFGVEPKEQEVFLANTLSRKKQIVPQILGAMK